MSSPPAATTTYPFTYTTFTNSAPAAFLTPSEFPSIFSWGPALACTATGSAQPSNLPIARPSIAEAACVISNAEEVNDHAFWDLYACCDGGNMTAIGDADTCTGQCIPGNGQTWQELGECLSGRVQAVVCKPSRQEIGNSTSSASSSRSATASQSATRSATPSGSAQASGSGAVVNATGAANPVGLGQTTSSKTGLMVFGILALGSAAGMFL